MVCPSFPGTRLQSPQQAQEQVGPRKESFLFDGFHLSRNTSWTGSLESLSPKKYKVKALTPLEPGCLPSVDLGVSRGSGARLGPHARAESCLRALLCPGSQEEGRFQKHAPGRRWAPLAWTPSDQVKGRGSPGERWSRARPGAELHVRVCLWLEGPGQGPSRKRQDRGLPLPRGFVGSLQAGPPLQADHPEPSPATAARPAPWKQEAGLPGTRRGVPICLEAAGRPRATLRARGSRASATVARPPPHPAGCHLGVTARGTRAYGPAAASPPAPPLLPDGGEARLGQGGRGPRQQPRAARRTPTGGRSRLPAALARPDEDLEVSLVLCEFVLCSSSATFGRICDGIGDQDPRPGPALSAA